MVEPGLSVASSSATSVRQRPSALLVRLRAALWACASVGLFVGMWEFAWWRGWADPLLLPPPHLFLANLAWWAWYTPLLGLNTGDSPEREPQRLTRQVNPEQIQVLPPQAREPDPPALAASAAPEAGSAPASSPESSPAASVASAAWLS